MSGPRLHNGDLIFHTKWKNPSNTRTYHVWQGMRQRCLNPKSTAYSYYGGRGIQVCDRWEDYDCFVEDMGFAPYGLQLDRIDTNGNYEPGNCRWVTASVQANNKRNNRIVEFGGEALTIGQWAERLGLDWDVLQQRIDRQKMPLERALTPGLFNGPAQHATNTMYVKGCRCQPCKDAHNTWQREYIAKRKDELNARRRKQYAERKLLASLEYDL